MFKIWYKSYFFNAERGTWKTGSFFKILANVSWFSENISCFRFHKRLVVRVSEKIFPVYGGEHVRTSSNINFKLKFWDTGAHIINDVHYFFNTGGDRHMTDEYRRNVIWLGVVTIVVVGHALYGIYKVLPNMYIHMYIQLLIIF